MRSKIDAPIALRLYPLAAAKVTAFGACITAFSMQATDRC
jgi:hypothetical protein